jgi:phosphate transport system substrate-binding protein
MKRSLVLATCLALLMAGVMVLFVPMNHAGASSYESITRQIEPADDWRWIVSDSAFQLGGISADSVVQDYGSYPSIDGSTVAVPMAMEFARQHLGLSGDDLYSFVFFTTTHNAYMNLFDKQPNPASKIMSERVVMDPDRPVDIVICTEPSDDERATAGAAGIRLIEHAVALDAFVFITHADNPANSLTVGQIQQIYGGIIKTWSEVGGNDANIRPYQRPANSGSQTAMENLVMKGEPLEAALPNYITSGMEGMVQAIGDYENNAAALGYT